MSTDLDHPRDLVVRPGPFDRAEGTCPLRPCVTLTRGGAGFDQSPVQRAGVSAAVGLNLCIVAYIALLPSAIGDALPLIPWLGLFAYG